MRPRRNNWTPWTVSRSSIRYTIGAWLQGTPPGWRSAYTATSAWTVGSPCASRCQLSPASWLANSSGPAAINALPASSTAICCTITSNCGGMSCSRRTQCSPPSSLRYRAALAPWRQLGGGPAAASVTQRRRTVPASGTMVYARQPYLHQGPGGRSLFYPDLPGQQHKAVEYKRGTGRESAGRFATRL